MDKRIYLKSNRKGFFSRVPNPSILKQKPLKGVRSPIKIIMTVAGQELNYGALEIIVNDFILKNLIHEIRPELHPTKESAVVMEFKSGEYETTRMIDVIKIDAYSKLYSIITKLELKIYLDFLHKDLDRIQSMTLTIWFNEVEIDIMTKPKSPEMHDEELMEVDE